VVPRLHARAIALLPEEQAPPPERGGDFPWWLVAAAALAAWLAWSMASDEIYRQILGTLSRGIGITAFVTLVAFGLASALGLLLAVCVLSGSLILRQAARFYIEIVRGVPILVLLFYIAFVAAPALVAAANAVGGPLGFGEFQTRDLSLMWRAIIALTIGYAAFIAEVFRAGIQSVEPGQIEAAKALGLGTWQRFRLIVFPQAIRTILPPLGNDFVALVKDSALVSVLGVADITQLGKIYAAGSFRFFETYNVVAFLYLVITVGLSLALRRLERRLAVGRRRSLASTSGARAPTAGGNGGA
jgi:polar amino acid transport system permease protein